MASPPNPVPVELAILGSTGSSTKLDLVYLMSWDVRMPFIHSVPLKDVKHQLSLVVHHCVDIG